MNLHELYEPDPLTFSFETPGWYVLAGIIFLLVLIVMILQIRKYKKNRYRREALRQLEALDNLAVEFLPLFVVLKMTAIHAFGRARVASLYGKEWLSFLDETGKDVQLAEFHHPIFLALYAGKELEEDMLTAIFSHAKKWIRTHAC